MKERVRYSARPLFLFLCSRSWPFILFYGFFNKIFRFYSRTLHLGLHATPCFKSDHIIEHQLFFLFYILLTNSFMKKFFISALLLGAGICAWAQLVEVSAVSKVDLPQGALAYVSTISPDGSFVVLSDMGTPGLVKLDLASGETASISSTGTSTGLKISDDGSTILFRDGSFSDKLRYTSLKSVNTKTGAETTIVSPSRDLNGFSISGSTVTAVEKGKVTTKGIGGVKTLVSAPVASIYLGQLYVTIDGNTELISPQGTEGQSYLWPSISPNGTKVLYYLVSDGCYVCNLDGSDPVLLGWLRAACWLDDNTVVGMQDYDGEYSVASSCLIAAAIDGSATQQLTDDSVKAMFPSASADGKKISFTTPEGELYVMDINK
ncbi:MAG: hypothetical protein LUE27_02355 [Clostridia bacterium]|nr:hypothetical protein [Clostridia bacterium]